MRKRFQRCFLAILLLGLSAAAQAGDTQLEIIPLHYSTVEDVLPMLQPFAGPGGAVSGMNGRLIVRATPANMAEIKRILAEVDKAPRRLMISVRQAGDLLRQEEGARLSGSIGGEHGRVTLPDDRGRRGGTVEIRSGNDTLRGRVYDSQSTQSSNETQRIQALEGRPAFIQAGVSQPITQRNAVINGRNVVVYDTTTYNDVMRGFYVVPRLNGDRVTLEIRTRNDTPGRRYGEASVQQADTVVTGRLGEWIEVGGINQSNSGQERSLGGSTTRTVSDSRSVYLKVEELQ